MKNKVVIIAGPTASGKSSVAKELALKENGVIINCDSMQVYDVLRIITARPSKQDEGEVEHRLYGYLSPAEACNANLWRERALKEIDDVISKGKLPIIVGGTGMYIKSLMEGLTPIPDIPTEIRKNARTRLLEEGSSSLYKEISEDDRKRLSENDSQRVCRAYEVLKATGKSMAYWNSVPNVGVRDDLDFDLRIIMPDLQELYKKCDGRFVKMIEQGAIEEVKALMSMDLDESLPAMKAIGVPEIISYIKEEMSLEEAIEKAQMQTRRYAKRQRTWFKKYIA
ncbi:MAG: tRNA (adenosine(37)-N6)-dimethylallyltransferase MiaA [Alphaproteobacteria bacterium]|nr:tRNA (adenosine(37)-N6)-dimethylallyltransferase MiaA [Alphaproteobacteria bacterium]